MRHQRNARNRLLRRRFEQGSTGQHLIVMVQLWSVDILRAQIFNFECLQSRLAFAQQLRSFTNLEDLFIDLMNVLVQIVLLFLERV